MSDVINNLVDNILNGDSLASKDSFEDAIAVKITDALDKRRMEIAQQIYSSSPEQEVNDGDEEEIEIETEDENG